MPSATAGTSPSRRGCCRSIPAFSAPWRWCCWPPTPSASCCRWEVMSLLSWALVLAHHREADTRRAGYVYLVMAAFGTMALLLGLRPAGRRPRAAMTSTAIRGAPRSPVAGGGDPGADADRRRIQGRAGAAACLAAAGASGRAEPCLGADERGDDQGRALRLHPGGLRPARPAALVGQPGGDRARRRDRGAGHPATPTWSATSSGRWPTARSRTSG